MAQNSNSEGTHVAMTVVVRLTDVCNLKCRMCRFYTHENSKGQQMSLEDFSIVLKKLKTTRIHGKKVDAIRLDGNREGLCYPDLDKAIAMTKEAGLRAVLVTNGVLLTPQSTKRLLKAGLDAINFSVTGITPETYSRFQGYSMSKEQFDRVCENITDFISQKKSLCLACSVSVSILMDKISGQNADEVRNALNFWSAMGCDSVLVGREYPPRKSKRAVGSPACASMPIINMDGNVYPCCGGSEDIVIGNLLHGDNVFNGDAAKQLYSALKGKGLLPDGCSSCVFNDVPARHIANYVYQPADVGFRTDGFEVFVKSAKGKKVFLFGCGEMAQAAIDDLRHANIPVEGIIDNNFWLWGNKMKDVPVMGPIFDIKTDDNVLLICTKNIRDARAFAAEMGFRNTFAYGYFFEKTYERHPIFSHSFELK